MADEDPLAERGDEGDDEDDDDDGPGMIASVRERVGQDIRQIKSWLWAHRRAIKRGFATIILATVAVGVLYLSYLLAGPLATIAYAIMFVLGFGLIPAMIMTLRDTMPNFVGRLMFALGQLGYGGSWLVQTSDGWEVCPRRRVDGEEQFYLDKWVTVADDSNMTRLGWAKFGIAYYKQADDMGQWRVDDHAVDEYAELQAKPDAPAAAEIASMSADDVLNNDEKTVADGGVGGLTADKPDQLLSKPGVWVVNFRSYWADRLQEIGEPDLLDDVERVAQREEALSNQVNSNRLLIGSAFGLLLGAATGYIAMSGF